MANELLNVQGLETRFKTPEGLIHAVNGVSFHLKEGETLGVVLPINNAGSGIQAVFCGTGCA